MEDIGGNTMVEPVLELNSQKNEKHWLDISKDNIKWSNISLSSVIKYGKRIDANSFNIDYRKAIKEIEQSKYGYGVLQGKEGIINSYRPAIRKRIFVEKSDLAIPMLIPSQITDIYPKPEKFLSIKMLPYISDWFVKKGEILLTCSGTIGNVSLVSNTLDGMCVSQNLIRIVPNKEEDLGYIYTFLKTNNGLIQLRKNNYGAVIKHIDPSHLDTILIPCAPYIIKKKIHDMIMESYSMRDKSNELIDKATDLLIKELELPPLDKLIQEAFSFSNKVNSFSVKLSNLKTRLEGSYHIPLVGVIEKYIAKNARIASLGDKEICKKIILPGRFKRVYVEKGNGQIFIGGKEVGELDPINKKYLSLVYHSERIKNELLLKENMVLVTCSGTIGKIAIVPKHWSGWAVNQHVLRLETTQSISGYVYVWLNSEYGRVLITRNSYGSVVDELTDKQMAEVKIPILNSKETMNTINSLVLSANKLRYEAYLLERKAIDIMNNDILEL